VAWSGDNEFTDQPVKVAFDNFVVNAGQLVGYNPEPEVEGPPYEVDAQTIALYHFDGDFQDAGPNGLHLTAAGGAQLASDNLGWMTEPAGQALRTGALGDQVSVTISDDLLLPGNGPSPLTVDAMIYPRAYKAYSVENARVVSLFQEWDTMLEVRDGKWNSPAVPHVMAGSQTVVSPGVWAANVALDTWHHLRMTFDTDGRARVAINGNVIGQQVVSMNIPRTGLWTLTLGNFDGDIDEVRVSSVIRTEGSPLTKPVASRPVASQSDAAPPVFGLSQNAPNPFNPTTTIRYALPEASDARLTIYNVLGQEVRALVHAAQPQGVHSVEWDGRDAFGRPVATGLYIYRLVAGAHVATRKMVFVK
jgi:hypothetical protein